MRKNGLNERLIIHAGWCCDSEISQAKEGIVFNLVLLFIGLVGGTLIVLL